MIRTLIIEDELPAQKLLSGICKEYCPDIEIIGITDCLQEAVGLIHQLKPDLIFLDIQLSDGISLCLFDLVPDLEAKVIFTSGYDNYALKAFKLEAVDYILKPFSHIEIIKAVSKVVRLFKDRDINNILQLAQISGLNKSGMNNKLKIVSSSGILFLNINDIIHIEADGSYSIVYLTNNKKYTACKSLKEFEENLSHRGFYRIHTSHLINVDYISQLNTTEGNVVCLENGSTIPVSRRNKQEFIKFLERV